MRKDNSYVKRALAGWMISSPYHQPPMQKFIRAALRTYPTKWKFFTLQKFLKASFAGPFLVRETCVNNLGLKN